MKMTALLLAGSFFLGGCAGGRVKSGVRIAGIDVGGMTYEEAVARVREKTECLPLTVSTPAGDFEAPLSYRDGLEELVLKAKRGKSYEVSVAREWITMEQDLDMVCRKNAREPIDAALFFDRDGFVYIPEQNGIACDFEGLMRAACAALSSGETTIALSCREVESEITLRALKARTQPLSVFSTAFDASNSPRAHNIALAAERISGTEIGAGEEFSFNRAVGKRTRENGFEEAAVIFDGEFVQGVGGGVCQTSTTLFGAALRAGMEITESHPHSLSVGYAPPSQDAMVSEYSDLKFKNPYPYPVYLLGEAKKGTVTFSLFGKPSGVRYEVESRVLFTLDPPPKSVVEGEENRTVRAEKKGLASESVLVAYGEGGEVSRTLIRRDTYAPVQGVEERAPAAPPEDTSSPAEEPASPPEDTAAPPEGGEGFLSDEKIFRIALKNPCNSAKNPL